MMSVTVTWSHVGSPPCSWESLLGEGSVSLNDWIPLLSHWSDHQSCNSPCVDPQLSPSGSSWGVVYSWSPGNVNLICLSPALKIGRMVMTVIYCDLSIGKLKNFYVWMICNVVDLVCHSEIDGCSLYRWSVIIVSCSCGSCIYPSVVTLNSPCMNCNNSSCNVFKNEIVIWISFNCLCLHGSVLNLIWHGNFWEVCDESVGFMKEVHSTPPIMKKNMQRFCFVIGCFLLRAMYL